MKENETSRALDYIYGLMTDLCDVNGNFLVRQLLRSPALAAQHQGTRFPSHQAAVSVLGHGPLLRVLGEHPCRSSCVTD